MSNQPTALDTYLQRLPMILDKIEALRQLASDHFGSMTRTPSTGDTSVTSVGWIRRWTICWRSSMARPSEGGGHGLLIKLSPAQSLLLRNAARRADGRVIPPDKLRGRAGQVLTALLQRGWIKPGDGGHLLTDAGCAAIGQQRPVPKMTSSRWLPLTTSNFWRASLCAGYQLAALVVALRRPQGQPACN